MRTIVGIDVFERRGVPRVEQIRRLTPARPRVRGQRRHAARHPFVHRHLERAVRRVPDIVEVLVDVDKQRIRPEELLAGDRRRVERGARKQIGERVLKLRR